MRRKRRQLASLRITGVVKALNTARERLSAGIPAGEIETFRKWVRDVSDQVERICREHGSRPENLSAPTYRAYLYLKNLSLQEISSRQNDFGSSGSQDRSRPEKPRQRAVRVANLVSACSRIQALLGEQAQEGAGRLDGLGVHDLLRHIQALSGQVEETCRRVSATPAELPDRSRRAYQWLKFLGEEANLLAHLEALRAAVQAGRRASCRKKLPILERGIEVRIEFYHLAALYRARVEKGVLHLVASEGFTGAPESILGDLICAALVRKKGAHLSRVRQYADSEDYAEILLALEMSVETGELSWRGQAYDLGEVFDRVNREYFAGRLERPRLTWNRTITHRKLGHYQPTTGTVMISITLDHPEVPAYLIDYVMYHELLHKVLGIQVRDGRRYAHTKTFRDAERKFRYYEQAQEALKLLPQKLAL